MALSNLSDLGGQVVLGDEGDETILPAKGDGTAKPGNPVSINSAGVVVQSDADASDLFTGFLLTSYETDVNAVITAGRPCSVVVPRSGHFYGVTCTDMNLGGASIPMIISTTAGSMGVTGDVEVAQAYSYKYDDGDTVAIIIWK